MVAAQALSLLTWDAIATLVLNAEPPALLTYHTRALRQEAIGLFAEALFVRANPSHLYESDPQTIFVTLTPDHLRGSNPLPSLC